MKKVVVIIVLLTLLLALLYFVKHNLPKSAEPTDINQITWVERTLKFTNSYNKEVTVLLPADWTIVIKNNAENKLKSSDNTSVFHIVSLIEDMGGPLPTDAVVIKKVDDNNEIVRTGSGNNYCYSNNEINPEPGYEKMRLDNGIWIKNGDNLAGLLVCFIYSGAENNRTTALAVADKIVSSITLK